MNYSNGNEVKVGDKVKLWDDCYGIVVASMDTGVFSKSHSEENWKYLKTGILIESEEAGLVHYLSSDDALELECVSKE